MAWRYGKDSSGSGQVEWWAQVSRLLFFGCYKRIFLKMFFAELQDSAKWYQGFRKTKMRNWRRLLLAVLNLYVRIKIHVDDIWHIIPSLMARIQSIFFNPEGSWFRSKVSSAQLAVDRVDVSGRTISLRLVIDFFTCDVQNIKRVLVFNFVFYLLWTGSKLHSLF